MKIKVVSRGQDGFTLMEALVSLSILLISITCTLGLFTVVSRNLVVPKHLTVATNIARAKMEEIKNTPFESITTSFPPNQPEEILSLPNGTLNISYPDGVGADPLAISVVVSWQEDDNLRNIELLTSVVSP